MPAAERERASAEQLASIVGQPPGRDPMGNVPLKPIPQPPAGFMPLPVPTGAPQLPRTEQAQLDPRARLAKQQATEQAYQQLARQGPIDIAQYLSPQQKRHIQTQYGVQEADLNPFLQWGFNRSLIGLVERVTDRYADVVAETTADQLMRLGIDHNTARSFADNIVTPYRVPGLGSWMLFMHKNLLEEEMAKHGGMISKGEPIFKLNEIAEIAAKRSEERRVGKEC